MSIWTFLKSFFENNLPDKYKFFSSLKDECITRKDYLHAINVWDVFKMSAMRSEL